MKIQIPKTAAERAILLREAEALRGADGAFKDDAAREAFDARMEAIEAFDKRPSAAQPSADEIRAAERARITGIQDAVRVAKLGADVAADLVGRNLTMADASTEIFRLMAKKQEEEQPPIDNKRGVEFGEDARDKFLRGAGAWLLAKSGMDALVAKATKGEIGDAGEFRGMTMLELAKAYLNRSGVSTGSDKMAVAAAALTHRGGPYQGAGDFAVLLETTMNKVLQAAYDVTPDTWRRFCAVRTAGDFRTQNFYRNGSFGTLDALNEHGEFKNKTIPDGEKATYAVSTKGNIIGLSRAAIVNDDMGAFNDLATRFGQAAALSIESDVFALLALNSGLGPTQADAQPFFHSNRKNVNGTGSALAVAGIDADRVIMAAQTDPSGNLILNLQPSVLLVQSGLGGTARVINDAQYDPDTVNKLQRPNMVRGLFRDIVDSPRIVAGSTRRYLFADPSIAPTIVVAFLDGQQSPVLESQNGWRVDGVEWKVRIDYGVAAVDFRGAVTNAGQ